MKGYWRKILTAFILLLPLLWLLSWRDQSIRMRHPLQSTITFGRLWKVIFSWTRQGSTWFSWPKNLGKQTRRLSEFPLSTSWSIALLLSLLSKVNSVSVEPWTTSSLCILCRKFCQSHCKLLQMSKKVVVFSYVAFQHAESPLEEIVEQPETVISYQEVNS